MDKKNNNLILPYRMGAYRPAPLPYGGTRAFMRLLTPSPYNCTGDFCVCSGRLWG
jgi:hypothetical protein